MNQVTWRICQALQIPLRRSCDSQKTEGFVPKDMGFFVIPPGSKIAIK
jgi:hypothetical protein